MADVFAVKGESTLTGLIPDISTGVSVVLTPTTSSTKMLLEGLIPSVGTGILITAPLGALTTQQGIGNAYISVGPNNNIPLQSVSLTGISPVLATGVTIEPPIGSLSFMYLEALFPEILARPRNFYAAVHGRSIEEVFIILVTLEHPDLEEPIRVANDVRDDFGGGTRGVRSQGENFYYMPFQVKLPNLEQDVIPVAKLEMDNISREITRAIAEINSPPTVRMQIVLSTDPNIVEYDLQGFKLNNTNYDVLVIEGDLTVEYFMNEPYPSVRFTPGRFPGLYRGRKKVQQ